MYLNLRCFLKYCLACFSKTTYKFWVARFSFVDNVTFLKLSKHWFYIILSVYYSYLGNQRAYLSNRIYISEWMLTIYLHTSLSMCLCRGDTPDRHSQGGNTPLQCTFYVIKANQWQLSYALHVLARWSNETPQWLVAKRRDVSMLPRYKEDDISMHIRQLKQKKKVFLAS